MLETGSGLRATFVRGPGTLAVGRSRVLFVSRDVPAAFTLALSQVIDNDSSDGFLAEVDRAWMAARDSGLDVIAAETTRHECAVLAFGRACANLETSVASVRLDAAKTIPAAKVRVAGSFLSLASGLAVASRVQSGNVGVFRVSSFVVTDWPPSAVRGPGPGASQGACQDHCETLPPEHTASSAVRSKYRCIANQRCARPDRLEKPRARVHLDTSTANPRIPGYSNFQLVGTGGSASVYRARQDRLDRNVAIKVIRDMAHDGQAARLFDTERRILGQLSAHPNIVAVYDSGLSNDGDPFLVMQWCPRGSVANLVRQSGPLSAEHTIRVGLHVAMALEFAHRQQTVHRDVKPENVLISELGEPLLSDFGIASMLLFDGSTVSGGGLSPHHVAPELLRGASIDPIHDLYSLGSTLFTLAVGHPPHQRSAEERLTIAELLGRVADSREPIELPQHVECPESLRLLLRSLLAKDPARRLQSAREVVEALRRVEMELGTAGRELALHDDMVPWDPSASQTSPLPARRTEAQVSGPGAGPDEILTSGLTGCTDPSIQPLTVRPGVTTPRSGRHTTAVLGKVASVASIALIGLIGVIAPVSRSSATRGALSVSKASLDARPTHPTAPQNVRITRVDPTTIDVSWDEVGGAGPSVEVAVYRGTNRYTSRIVARPPARISELDLSAWVPCVLVRVVASPPAPGHAPNATCTRRIESVEVPASAPGRR